MQAEISGWLDRTTVRRFFSAESPHVTVRLRALSNARLLWLNRRVVQQDPVFSGLGGRVREYEDYLLRVCAVEIDNEPRLGSSSVGIVDRYGGKGLGRNGGSGRSVIVDGYIVKGAGRTPLVSPLTSRDHATGRATLDECVREAIFSEIVDLEFPYSAVPTLAIIDAGARSASCAEPDRGSTLLVRPCFLRPAHFERATLHLPSQRAEAVRDVERVAWMFIRASELYGTASLVAAYDALWDKWASQLAYSYVHRLGHSGHSTSNISIDGRLVDFGGMTAIPSWYKVTTVLGRYYFGEELRGIAKAVKDLSYYFGRYLDPHLADGVAIGKIVERLTSLYQREVGIEMLRLFGLSRVEAHELAGNEACRLAEALGRFHRYFWKERVDIVSSTPDSSLDIDVSKVWSADPPSHLRALGELLRGNVCSKEWGSRQKLCANMSRVRGDVYREELRKELRGVFHTAASASRAEVDATISTRVHSARRDF